jgi:hypothetical protein
MPAEVKIHSAVFKYWFRVETDVSYIPVPCERPERQQGNPRVSALHGYAWFEWWWLFEYKCVKYQQLEFKVARRWEALLNFHHSKIKPPPPPLSDIFTRQEADKGQIQTNFSRVSNPYSFDTDPDPDPTV